MTSPCQIEAASMGGSDGPDTTAAADNGGCSLRVPGARSDPLVYHELSCACVGHFNVIFARLGTSTDSRDQLQRTSRRAATRTLQGVSAIGLQLLSHDVRRRESSLKNGRRKRYSPLDLSDERPRPLALKPCSRARPEGRWPSVQQITWSKR